MAPWRANSASVAIPAATVKGLNRSVNVPAKLPSESIGTPCTRFASAIPQISGAPTLPTTFAHNQAPRQRVPLPFWRHSNDTTRTISSTSTSSSAT